MTDLALVDLARLQAEVGVAAKEYAAADPFPHIVVDDVLRPEAFAAAAADFPTVDDEFWKATCTSTRPSTATSSPTPGRTACRRSRGS